MQRIQKSQTTAETMQEMGDRLRGYRLQQNRRLEEVAATAGVAYTTAVRAESGDNPTLGTLVKILRALDRLDALDAFLPPPLVSPLQMAELARRTRQRAGRPRRPQPGD